MYKSLLKRYSFHKHCILGSRHSFEFDLPAGGSTRRGKASTAGSHYRSDEYDYLFDPYWEYRLGRMSPWKMSFQIFLLFCESEKDQRSEKDENIF